MRLKVGIIILLIIVVIGVEGQNEWNFKSQSLVPQLKVWHFLGPFTIGKTEVDGGMLKQLKKENE